MEKTILVIEDEEAIRRVLGAFLTDAGFRVELAADGPRGLELFRRRAPDLVLLDLLLPGLDGFSVCRAIRRESRVPVIMLTALDDDAHQLEGFDALADDYITKPFSMPLVVRRIQAVLRRAGGGEDALLRWGPITLDAGSFSVRVGERPAALTAREFQILKLLLENPGRVFTREALLDSVWGYDFFGDRRIVNTHIKNIRRKLGVEAIKTVRGVGYKIEKEAE